MRIQGAVRSDVVHIYCGSALSSVPASIVELPKMSSLEGCGGAQGLQPEPVIINWCNASKSYVASRRTQPSTTNKSKLPSAKGAGASQISSTTKEQ